MHIDEVANIVDDVLVEAQCLEAFACHRRSDSVVVVEADFAVRFEAASTRLADVVVESCQAQL